MTHASRAEFRAELLAKIPGWYSPAAHLVLPPLATIAIAAFAISRLHDLRLWQLALVPVFLAIGNAIEWHAHRGPLHRRTRFLEKMYLHHTPQHHALYVSDAMAIHSARELRFVLLPGYGVLALLAATSPVVLFFFAVGQPNLAALWVASAVAYLLSYEWLHLAYHLPESSWIARIPLIERLRRHHQLHHVPVLMQRWNFNVTLPLWDLVRGTLYASPFPVSAGAEPVPVRRAR
jgi:hypothetical protein